MAERQTERSQSIPRLWPFKRLFYGWGIVGTSMVVLIAQAPMYGPVLSVFVKPIGDDLGWSRGEISLAFTLGRWSGCRRPPSWERGSTATAQGSPSCRRAWS